MWWQLKIAYSYFVEVQKPELYCHLLRSVTKMHTQLFIRSVVAYWGHERNPYVLIYLLCTNTFVSNLLKLAKTLERHQPQILWPYFQLLTRHHHLLARPPYIYRLFAFKARYWLSFISAISLYDVEKLSARLTWINKWRAPLSSFD